MSNPFKRAQRRGIKARIALVGPSGSGKTMWGLVLGKALAGEGDLAVIDTEHESALRYADLFEFDHAAMTNFDPDRYVKAIEMTQEAGYPALLIDSLSHAWTGKGGALDQVDRAASRSNSGNSFAAWREVTPKHNSLVEALLACQLHLIVTMRAKTEYVLEPDSKGRMAPRKVGLAPVQRDGLEYEFDVVFDVNLRHELVASKSRCPALTDHVFGPDEAKDLAAVLVAWIGGEAMPVAGDGFGSREQSVATKTAPLDDSADADVFGGDEEAPDVEETTHEVEQPAEDAAPVAEGSVEPEEAPAEPHSDGETVRKLMGAYGGVATEVDWKTANRQTAAARKAGKIREGGTAEEALKAAVAQAKTRYEVVADVTAMYQNARDLQQWANAEETYTHHVNAKVLRDGSEAMQRVTRARLVSYCKLAAPNHAESVRMEIDAARGAGNLPDFSDEEAAVSAAWDEYQARVAEPVKE